jgi:putative ABC transport system permease protein
MTFGAVASGIGLAFDAIRAHKLRAVLTTLGVIIGTSTIIGVGSIIAGFDGAITNVLRSFGGNTLIVFKFKVGVRVGGLTAEERTRKPLQLEHARAIEERSPSVQLVCPYLFPSWNMIHIARYKGQEVYNLDIGGTEVSYASDGGQAEMMTGRFFTEVEDLHKLPVAVIGEDLYKALFSNIEAVGKSIEFDGHSFEVIGVMKRPAATPPGENDNRLILPYRTMRKMFPSSQEHMLVVVAKPGKLQQAADEVRTVLRMERRLGYTKPDDFFVSTAEQMVEDFRRITSVTALVMIVLSSIGLLVGGIGVMNIMLVSVTERTREIGIRKAVGARRADIVLQFLTEAVVLTGMGGLLGMMLGYGISAAARFAFPSLPTAVPLWAVGLGVAVSVGIGIFFGIWPANKAARLDPVEALRYE